ncbi:hypothetical protein CEXT_483761 [Caerostris extrusa]|uniref:Uncharacterized protein n=1 Tax=Caerostris extrusa TaxID=172846 RepID=A0AAV4XWS1_CAEEX|nr:hypothetical protein CEXT_483761 [Caerostris extrusa]
MSPLLLYSPWSARMAETRVLEDIISAFCRITASTRRDTRYPADGTCGPSSEFYYLWSCRLVGFIMLSTIVLWAFVNTICPNL